MKRKKTGPTKRPPEESLTDKTNAAHIHLAGIALLVILCSIVYSNSLSNGFVYSDFGCIVENRYIKQPARLFPGLFNHSYYKIAGLETSYRPVSTASYFLVYAFAQLDPFYYHLASLLLHTLNVALIYALAFFILQHRLKALVAGGLFASHPVLTETVNCIAFNDDLLTTFFFLLAFLIYARIKTDQVKSSMAACGLSLLFYLLGLLSKEMAITLPVVIVLYDLVLRDGGSDAPGFGHLLDILKKRAPFYAGYAAVSLFYLFLRFYLFKVPAESAKSSYGSLVERIIYLPGHLFNYIRLMVFPANLTADHMFSYPDSFFSSANLVGFAIVTALAGAGFYVYRYSKVAFFGLWWFLITIMPVSNLIEIFHPLAERYLYLPLIGFCLVVPVLIFGLAGRLITRTHTANLVSAILIIGMIGIYSAATIARNPVWRDNYSLWTKTLQASPHSLAANGGLGMVYMERGMLEEARRQFEIAIKLYPDHHKSYYNLGLIYHQKGDLKKSMYYFNRTVALDPDSVRGHYNLATLYAKQGKMETAIAHYTQVIELDPEMVEAHYNLGMAYAMKRQLERAISHWEIVLQLEPRHTAARNNLAKARRMLNSAGRPENN
jgi:tetratricopeptide (TPR) repeat protein